MPLTPEEMRRLANTLEAYGRNAKKTSQYKEAESPLLAMSYALKDAAYKADGMNKPIIPPGKAAAWADTDRLLTVACAETSNLIKNKFSKIAEPKTAEDSAFTFLPGEFPDEYRENMNKLAKDVKAAKDEAFCGPSPCRRPPAS